MIFGISLVFKNDKIQVVCISFTACTSFLALIAVQNSFEGLKLTLFYENGGKAKVCGNEMQWTSVWRH